jgi:hypothetical protein
MNGIEKASAIIGAIIFVFGIGVGWDSLNNRIDKVDEKIGAIQRTLGSTTCNAILSRQMEAIDKNKIAVRAALDKLSDQYGCGPHNAVVVGPGFGEMNAATASDAHFNAQLNAVDVQLNKRD